MPATKMTPSVPYAHFGKTRIYFVATIADAGLVPTRAELDGGTDVADEITGVDGWNVTSNDIDIPVLGKAFIAKIPGRTSADDSSLTFLADETGTDATDLVPRGTNGFIVILYHGDVAGNVMSVFPVRSKSTGRPISTDENAATVEVQFSITDEPAENLAVPAHV